jgi:hypothetical protein
MGFGVERAGDGLSNSVLDVRGSAFDVARPKPVPNEKVKAESEKQGALVNHIDHCFMDPTSYSVLK